MHIYIYVLEDDTGLKSPFLLDLGNILEKHQACPSYTLHVRYRPFRYFHHMDITITPNGVNIEPIKTIHFKKSKQILDDITQFLHHAHPRTPRDTHVLVIESHGYNTYVQTAGKAYAKGVNDAVKMEMRDFVKSMQAKKIVFDAVLLDACCMSTIHTAAILKPITKYMMASEYTVPYLGMLSKEFLPLLTHRAKPLVERLNNVGQAYVQRNTSTDPKWDGLKDGCDVAVLDLTKLDTSLLQETDLLKPVAKYRVIKDVEYRVYDLFASASLRGTGKAIRTMLKNVICFYAKTHSHKHTHGIAVEIR